MCLGIPSRVISTEKNPLGMTMGRVEAGGVVREVCMDYVPGTAVGDFVMVQMGFAVSRISEQEAGNVIDALDRIVDLSSLHRPPLGGGPGPGGGTVSETGVETA